MLEYVAYVNRGLVHETNDDAAMLNHSVVHEGFFKGKSEVDDGLFAVADGVGSIENSELASRRALYCLMECNPRKNDEILSCINKANEELLEISKRTFGSVLSTTLCMVAVVGNTLVSYNLGNSRLYRFRDGYLRQLTRDHTKVQKLLDSGLLDYESAKDCSDKNIITSYLGSNSFSTGWITVSEHSENYLQEDILFLCTDGIHDYLEIDLLEKILSVDASLEEKANVIIQCANDSGGMDNETIVLIKKV